MPRASLSDPEVVLRFVDAVGREAALIASRPGSPGYKVERALKC